MSIGRAFNFTPLVRNSGSGFGDARVKRLGLIMTLVMLATFAGLLIGVTPEARAQTVDLCPKQTGARSQHEKAEDARKRVACLEGEIYESIISASTRAGILAQRASDETQRAELFARFMSDEQRIEKLRANLEEANEDLQEETEVLDFVKNNFGIGFAAGFGRSTRIDSASVDSQGIVRIDEEVTDSPRIVLEAHRFLANFRDGTIGLGPFATVNFGIDGEETLSSVGLGVMVGFRGALKGTRSLNFGVAYSLDRGVKTLRRDFVEGSPAPLNDEGVPIEPAFETSSDRAVLVVISITP